MIAARLAVIVLGLAAVAACDRPSRSVSVTVRDSAGIRIVENHAPAWEPGDEWTLAPTPSLAIGRVEGELPYVFSRVAGATRLGDGRIVVADGQSNEVRFFGPDGTFLMSVGREGEGPGEYQYIRHLDRCFGDSIVVFDLNWQFTLYDTDGTMGRTRIPLLQPGLSRTPYNLSCSRAGTFVMTGWGIREGPPPIGYHRTSAPISLLDGEGEQIATIGEYPSSERIGHEHGSRPHPFGKSTTLSIGDDRFFVGTADRYEIEVFDLTGTLSELWRAPASDRTIAPEELERYREAQLEGVSEANRPAAERSLRDMPVLESYPAYAEMWLGREGNLWVKDFVRPASEWATWAVFASDGALLGRVRFPIGLDILEIGSDYVLGVVEDDLGVERVVLHGLEKPEMPTVAPEERGSG
jgi:hypothetical protein